jgi:ParB-like chromosome segregation protein Spo0J
MSNWQNRIVGQGEVDPKTLIPNSKNYRRHPKGQVSALHGSLSEVGWVAPVTVNRTTGKLVDGHARVELAIRHKAKTVPVQYVELTDAEESLVLATLDPISAMATHDAEALDALLRDVQTGDAALQEMLAGLAESVIQPADAEWASAFGALPDEDRAPFQQMTFTLHDSQAEDVKRAVTAAKKHADFAGLPNENTNGNGLWWICSQYLEGTDG